MSRAKIGELIKIRERPEATLSLVRAVKDAENTVESYIFTDSIRRDISIILEAVIKGDGGGFWIQAEYGAGKTHFLATLTSLLTHTEENIWNKVGDPEIRNYRKRLMNNKLFPVVINLKGAGNPDPSKDNLLEVLERGIEDSLEERGERGKVEITSDDEIVGWYNKQAQDLKEVIDRYIKQKKEKDPRQMEKRALASCIREYCEKSEIKPQISSTTKDRISYIYKQLRSIGYSGMLFVIDEFAGWQKNHPRSSENRAYSIDEDVLETIAWILPRENGLNTYAIVASADAPPAKLKGERFIQFSLFARGDEKEFDVIVARRVRDLIEEKLPEIREYYEYYRANNLMKGVGEDYFIQIFPFQPRCFDAIRGIVRNPEIENLASVRSAIHYIYDVVSDKSLLDRDTLIRVCDLLYSRDLTQDINMTLRDAYASYNVAIEGIKDLGLEEYADLAKDIVSTLFIWYIVNKDALLSPGDLAEMTLAPDTFLKNVDIVEYVLSKLRDLPQIRYTKGKGAVFNVSEESDKRIKEFNKIKRAILDADIKEYWLRSLTLPDAIFEKIQEADSPSREKATFRNVEYPGEVVLARAMRNEYYNEIKEELHFRIVFLTERSLVDSSALKDKRIAVCVPSDMSETLVDLIRDYAAISKMREEYNDRSGPDVDYDKEWIREKERSVIKEILGRQYGIYRNGEIITSQGLGIEIKKIFSTDKIDDILASLVEALLASAYTEQPFDSSAFKKKLQENDAKKIFEGFFKGSTKTSAIDACRNFGFGLGLSKATAPEKFDPIENNKMFQLIRAKLDENPEGVQTWKIYRELEKPPYGVRKDIITLYLLSFVRANTNAEIRLKSSAIRPIKKINSFNVEEVEWRSGIEDDFDILIRSAEITWNDVLPYARKISPELHSAYAPDEIRDQEKALIEKMSSIRELAEKTEGDLETLAGVFGDDVSMHKASLDRLRKICSAKDYREFYDLLEEIYSKDGARLEGDVGELDRLRAISNKSAMLLSIRTYLEKLKAPPSDPALVEKDRIMKEMKLTSMINDPALVEKIIEDFEKLKKEYTTRYQIGHREYHKEVEDLRKNLENVKFWVETLERLRKLMVVPSSWLSNYEALMDRVKPCAKKDPVDVSSEPICTCGYQIGAKPPTEEVENFIGNVERSLRSGIDNLIQLIKPLEQSDSKGTIKNLIALKDRMLDVCKLLDDTTVEYVKELQEKANIVQIESDLLKKFSGELVGEESVQAVADKFREELRAEIERAKSENPGKKIQMVLK